MCILDDYRVDLPLLTLRIFKWHLGLFALKFETPSLAISTIGLFLTLLV